MYYAANLKQETGCNGCGICVVSCPEGNAIEVVQLEGKKKKVKIREVRCKGCGLCVELCPREALEMVLK